MATQTLERETSERNVHCDEEFVQVLEGFVKTQEAEKDHDKNELNKFCRKVEFYVEEGHSTKDAIKKAEPYKNFWHKFNLVDEKYRRKVEYYQGLGLPRKEAKKYATPWKNYWHNKKMNIEQLKSNLKNFYFLI